MSYPRYYGLTGRSTTGKTLFSLAYGYEAMVTVEIEVGSLRRENHNPEQNETLQRRELDLSKKNDVTLNLES